MEFFVNFLLMCGMFVALFNGLFFCMLIVVNLSDLKNLVSE